MRSSSAADTDAFAGLTGPGGVRHQPGLDGLRGLAVAAVVVFHTGLGWLPGGYLGVSLFFTVSGTVIGTVVLDEIDRRGRFSLRTFWARRGRRLLPAAWVVLAVVAVVRVTSTVFASTGAGDIVASWLQVANWWFVTEDRSYGALFEGPSAVLHFWSLAIEEQFYVVVGLAALTLGRAGRRAATALGLVAGVLALVSFALPLAVRMGVDRVYYGTDTRAGELLAGLVLAAVIAPVRRRRALLRVARPLAGAGLVALAGTVALWTLLDAGTDGLRRGLLPLTALTSSALILGALLPGPVRSLLTVTPLRRLGDISYGLYLVHWPVLIAMRHVVADPGVVACVVAVAVSVALAWLSAHLVELPVRRRRLLPAPLALGALTVVAALGVALVVPARVPASQAFLDRLATATLPNLAPAPGAAVPATAAAPTPAAPSTVTAAASPPASANTVATPPPTSAVVPTTPAPLPRLEILGDSIGFSLQMSLGYAAGDARFTVGDGEIEFGCGVTGDPGTRCGGLVDAMIEAIPARTIDAVLVVSCQWELLGRASPEQLLARYREVAERLRSAGATDVLWLRCPRLSEAVRPPDLPAEMVASRDPARVAALGAVIDQLGADGVVDVVALDAWVEPRVDDADLRPDGAHFEWERDSGVAAALTMLLNDALQR